MNALGEAIRTLVSCRGLTGSQLGEEISLSAISVSPEDEQLREEVADYEVKVSKGFERIRESAFPSPEGMTGQNYRQPPADKSKIGLIVFVGFAGCLQTAMKLQSDTERKMAVTLDRDSERWFKPAKGQFQIVYRFGSDHREYQPNFVAKTTDAIYVMEPKANNETDDPEVVSKKTAAIAWCQRASHYTAANSGKPWRHALIPHAAIAESMTLAALVQQFIRSAIKEEG